MHNSYGWRVSMNKKFVSPIFLALSFSFNVYGLVDYSEPETISPSGPSKRAISVPKKISKRSAPRGVSTGSHYTPSGMFDVGMSYKSIDVKSDETSGKVNVMEVKGHMPPTSISF